MHFFNPLPRLIMLLRAIPEDVPVMVPKHQVSRHAKVMLHMKGNSNVHSTTLKLDDWLDSWRAAHSFTQCSASPIRHPVR